MNNNWAFYGTLRDPDILRWVSGEDLAGQNCGEAILPDLAAYYVQGEVYPGIKREPSALLPLSLYKNLSVEAIRRLCIYEGDEYEPLQMAIGDVLFSIFVTSDSERLSEKPWSLREFQELHKAAYLDTLAL